MMVTRTIKLRLKDKHAKQLGAMARSVNFVWNYVNDLCFTHLQRKGKFFSAYDVSKYTKGAAKELGLHSQTVQAVTEELVLRRKQFKRAKLRWRVSNPNSPRRSLGWIPFKKSAIKYINGQIRYNGHCFSFWDSYGLTKYKDGIRSGSFVEDARGRWYLCLTVYKDEAIQSFGTSAIGIDLGLKDLATCSDGVRLKNLKTYRKHESKLAIAQRARNKKRIKNIHAKIKNIRADNLHKESTMLVKSYAAIFVGNVNSKALSKTKMAKSVLDAGWSMFKTMLQYKSENAGVWYEEVNEAYTTQTCSCCGSRHGSPKGRSGLGIREWTCGACNATHDRDVNAAKNILAVGHHRLAVGIPVL